MEHIDLVIAAIESPRDCGLQVILFRQWEQTEHFKVLLFKSRAFLFPIRLRFNVPKKICLNLPRFLRQVILNHLVAGLAFVRFVIKSGRRTYHVKESEEKQGSCWQSNGSSHGSALCSMPWAQRHA